MDRVNVGKFVIISFDDELRYYGAREGMTCPSTRSRAKSALLSLSNNNNNNNNSSKLSLYYQFNEFNNVYPISNSKSLNHKRQYSDNEMTQKILFEKFGATQKLLQK